MCYIRDYVCYIRVLRHLCLFTDLMEEFKVFPISKLDSYIQIYSYTLWHPHIYYCIEVLHSHTTEVLMCGNEGIPQLHIVEHTSDFVAPSCRDTLKRDCSLTEPRRRGANNFICCSRFSYVPYRWSVCNFSNKSSTSSVIIV